MKNLELNQMENLSGGLSCGSGLGLATGVILSGALIMAAGPFGVGASLYLLGAGGLFAAGGNCANS